MFKINKMQLKISISLALFAFAIFTITNNTLNTEPVNEFNDSSMVAFMEFAISLDEEIKNIEVFDISKGQIINRQHSNELIQNEAIEYLKGITGMYPKTNAISDKGYIVRIPLEPSVSVKNQWLDEILNEVYIIFPSKDNCPYLLILDDKNRPLFYTFNSNTDTLLKNIDLEL
ncbi:hypothetical protein RBH29_01095 [Herbivorax sp. ANBcel31]|uniref:hypothetical protein n=1 Tax=Herbivorax sp. ANBcel31 TaxID=3069754 RepID=UPI0027AF4CBD|nr:hypothetical protein [Herbivorax sp. ANBcel31]MDQ2085033.1 hypothetical protein [Herbivorax sp. ANBcel31]